MFISNVDNVLIRENVVFEKVNEVYVNEGRWLVVFVHDLKPYIQFIDKVQNDINFINSILRSEIDFYKTSNMSGYYHTMKNLQVELDMINETFLSVKENFVDFQSINMKKGQRNKRSLIPIVGQAMSFLFGTVSEDDLEEIDKNVRIIAQNQENIIHDLEVGLSLLNMSRVEIAENRRNIMDLVKYIVTMDSRISDLQKEFEQKFYRMEQFVNSFLQFDLIINEIRILCNNAILFLENLKVELNSLSMHHLSMNTMTPNSLRKLLREVESKLPNNFELPENPMSNIWYYYKALSCITYLENNEIRVVLKIQLLNTKERTEKKQKKETKQKRGTLC